MLVIASKDKANKLKMIQQEISRTVKDVCLNLALIHKLIAANKVKGVNQIKRISQMGTANLAETTNVRAKLKPILYKLMINNLANIT